MLLGKSIELTGHLHRFVQVQVYSFGVQVSACSHNSLNDGNVWLKQHKKFVGPAPARNQGWEAKGDEAPPLALIFFKTR